MGGILVDEQHRTPIQNLYAAGECCAQYHGANRLGGNSLLGALYGGRVAAKSACEQADVVDLSCATQIDFPPKNPNFRNKAIKQSDAGDYGRCQK